MDHPSKIVENLASASLFEIYQTSTILRKILRDPTRLAEIRAKLLPNQVISYFNASTNQEIAATVMRLGPTKALLRNQEDAKLWQVPYYMINLKGLSTPTAVRSGKVDKLRLRVGDSVGFMDRQNKAVYGVVQKLNTKTASLKNHNDQAWRVPYELLFHVMDAIPIKATQKNKMVILA